MVDRQQIETRVLAGLKERLLAPDLVAEFVREFADARREQQKEGASEHRRLKSQYDDVERKLNGVIKAIENGAWSEALNSRLTELEREKASLKAALDSADVPSPIVLHPNAADVYRQKVEDLQTALNDPTIKPAAMEALKALFEKIVLTPDAAQPDGLRVELHGALAAILRLGAQPNAAKSGDLAAFGTSVLCDRMSVVAGTRNHLDLLLTGWAVHDLSTAPGRQRRPQRTPAACYRGNRILLAEGGQAQCGFGGREFTQRRVVMKHSTSA